MFKFLIKDLRWVIVDLFVVGVIGGMGVGCDGGGRLSGDCGCGLGSIGGCNCLWIQMDLYFLGFFSDEVLSRYCAKFGKQNLLRLNMFLGQTTSNRFSLS